MCAYTIKENKENPPSIIITIRLHSARLSHKGPSHSVLNLLTAWLIFSWPSTCSHCVVIKHRGTLNISFEFIHYHFLCNVVLMQQNCYVLLWRRWERPRLYDDLSLCIMFTYALPNYRRRVFMPQFPIELVSVQLQRKPSKQESLDNSEPVQGV